MQQALSIAQIIISLVITVLILMQAQGTGLGSSWSGGGETYHTRRGVEKVIFYLTIFFIVLFIATALANIII